MSIFYILTYHRLSLSRFKFKNISPKFLPILVTWIMLTSENQIQIYLCVLTIHLCANDNQILLIIIRRSLLLLLQFSLWIGTYGFGKIEIVTITCLVPKGTNGTLCYIWPPRNKTESQLFHQSPFLKHFRKMLDNQNFFAIILLLKWYKIVTYF